MRETIPTAKIWCLPGDITKSQLESLHKGIVNVMASFSDTGVKDERDMLNLFPRDLMAYGLGSEIKIEITDLPIQCGVMYRDIIARKIGEFVSAMFPKANVFCTAKRRDPDAGAWSSKKDEK